jgi:hypothetical protein
VGLPTNSTYFTENGSLWVFSGRTGQALILLHGTTPGERLGTALVALGDISGDGAGRFCGRQPELERGVVGRVQLVSGADGTILATLTGPGVLSNLGFALELVGDVDGDQRPDLGLGFASGSVAGYSPPDRVAVRSLPSLALIHTVVCPAYTSFGAAGDVNGDGADDLVTLTIQNGVLSPPFTLHLGSAVNQSISGPSLGTTNFAPPLLAPASDLDGDGIATEFAIGHGYFGANEPGRVWVFRGTQLLATLFDATNSTSDYFGGALAVAGDTDGNGSDELIVGAFRDGFDPVSITSSGRVVLLSPRTPEPVGYCTAKPNGLGCVPQLASVGVVSLSGAEVLTVAATNVLNRRTGLCLWGTQRQEVPFAGGYLCVAPPFHRGPATNSGGSASGDDCSGRLEFNLLPLEMWLHGVEIGDLVRLQFWQRDPLNVDGTGASLSAALEAPRRLVSSAQACRSSSSEQKPGPIASSTPLVPGFGGRCSSVRSRMSITDALERLPALRSESQEIATASSSRPSESRAASSTFGPPGWQIQNAMSCGVSLWSARNLAQSGPRRSFATDGTEGESTILKPCAPMVQPITSSVSR